MENTVKAKVEQLLAQMTLEEKVAQMIQIPYPHVGREKALEWAEKGAGSFLHVFGDQARELQKVACSNRLGIPVIFGIDAVRGHALNDHATIFPTQLACACTWNKDLVHEMGRVTAREVAADGVHWTFSPLLCLARDPRWGRTDETFGEDPYLTGELAAELIKGYQGQALSDDDSILACAKHYIAYGEATGARDSYDSQITYRKMREVFLPPFKKAVDAGCATFMTAYGAIDGTPLTIDKHSLKDILRDELGFDGFVVTDWANVTSLVQRQFIAQDEMEASRLAAEAGNDMIMNSAEFYESTIQLVREGKLDETVIDNAVRNILAIKVKMDLFSNPAKNIPQDVIGCEFHQKVALETARRSITLLKNEDILPVKDTVKKIAVVGANADDIAAQYGDWAYFSHPQPNPDREPIRPYTTVKEGVETLTREKGIAFTYARGCGPLPSDTDDLDEAVAAANDADLIIYVAGDVEDQIGEGKDRADLALSGRQEELFVRLQALNIPLVTVLVASKPLAIGNVVANSKGVLVAFNGGAHGGQAVAEVLFGKQNPSGRLPISFPHHSGQVPVYYNQLPGWHGGKYCDLPQTPLFAFGEGLSYTSFDYRNLKLDIDTLTATIEVTNTGDLPGIETVQVYFRDCVASLFTPIKQLIAFQQVVLEPGETKQISFTFDKMDFSLVNRKEERVVEPGEFLLMVGHSSKDEDLLRTSFYL